MVWGREGSSASVTPRRREAPPISTRRDSSDQLIDPNSPNHSTYRLHGGLILKDGPPKGQMPSIRFIPHQDPGSARPSLQFDPISRILPSVTDVIRVGRYSEKDGQSYLTSDAPSSAPVGFKSKVVSRKHCEFWFQNGQWHIKDVKSSSGTFLNRLRLSPASTESRPYQVNDGDIIQLGIDFKGGEEAIFRCVKMRVECNRDWQKAINPFNIRTLRRLQNLSVENGEEENDMGSTHTSDCSICLLSIAPCQSLFVAPCSHVWHYKCIRPILTSGSIWGRFQCPNCRAVADLDAEIEDVSMSWRGKGVERDGNGVDGTAREGAGSIGQPSGSARPSDEAASMSRNDATPHNFNGNSSTTNTDLQPGESQQTLQTASQPATFQQHFARYRLSLEGAIQEIDGVAATGNSAISPNISSTVRASAADQTQPNASTEHLIAEGPMTPRNDVGPFVLDGTPRATNAHASGVLLNLNAATSAGWESDFGPGEYFYTDPVAVPEQEEQEL